MRDKTHNEQVERWANYVREHPEEWKSKLKPFLDSQIAIAIRFYKNLAKTEDGREKIKMIRSLKQAG